MKRELDIDNEKAPELSKSQEVKIKEAVVAAINGVRSFDSCE